MRWCSKGWMPVAALVLAFSGSAAVVAPSPATPGEFRFVQVIYTDNGNRPSFRGWWQQDYTEAEENFLPNLQRMTRVSVGLPEVLSLTDERLFEFPWLYATQTGDWALSDA